MKLDLNKRKLINYLLLPLAIIFYILSGTRKYLYKFNFLNSYKTKKPLIIIGNIIVGGTGKTPITIEVVNFLQDKNLKVGVISRGYGRENKNLIVVNENTKTNNCGDEPKLIYLKTQAKVVVSANKVEAVKELESDVDVIISDDGLQHYALKRDIEIIVFNGFSNGFYLPAGGLREGKNRLKNADIIISDTDKEDLPLSFINAKTKEKYPLDYFTNEIIAICGIANPERFFNTLKKLDINFQTKIFTDHYNFKTNDFNYKIPIITTAKDWVKYKDFDLNNMENIFYLDIKIKLNDKIFKQLNDKLNYVK